MAISLQLTRSGVFQDRFSHLKEAGQAQNEATTSLAVFGCHVFNLQHVSQLDTNG